MSQAHPSEQLLLDWCLRDRLEAAELDALERHLFECAECTARSLALAAMIDGLAGAVKAMPPIVVTDAQLADFERAGRTVQRVDLNAFEQRDDRVDRGFELTVTRVHVDLTGVDRIDVRLCTREGQAFIEVLDAPFEPSSGVVNVACDSHVASANPAFRVRISGVRSGQTVELADCLALQK